MSYFDKSLKIEMIINEFPKNHLSMSHYYYYYSHKTFRLPFYHETNEVSNVVGCECKTHLRLVKDILLVDMLFILMGGGDDMFI
jgi:hypothetical protein